MKRRLIKFSNYSFCITLPKKAVDQLGWGKGEVVEVDFDAKTKKITVFKGKNNSQTSKKKADLEPDDSSQVKPIPKLRW